MKTHVFHQQGYDFMGAAFEVYNQQGYDLAEEVYQECLEIELDIRQMRYQPKQELACFYKGRELKGGMFRTYSCWTVWSLR